MRNSIAGGAILALAAAAAAPVAAQNAPAKTATCDAKYYDNLIGKDLDRARTVNSSNYRLLPAGGAAGQAKPRRMTIVYDTESRTIVDVTCG